MKNVDVIRENLLELHRVLVEEERRAYERTHGKTTAGQFLDVLVNHEDLAWLKPLTALIVALDDDEVDHASWAERARTMLRPDAEGGPFRASRTTHLPAARALPRPRPTKSQASQAMPRS